MPDPRRQLAAVVLNYCTYASTITCVRHLLASSDIRRVYIVDNASPDGSGRAFHRHFAEGAFSLEQLPAGSGNRGCFSTGVEVVLLKAMRNEGYGPGNNLALRLAFREGHDVALVVNPDVVVEPAAIALMLQRLRLPVAVVGNVLWNDEAHTKLECFGAAIYSRLTSRSRSTQSADETRRGNYFSGACFVADLAAIRDAGWLAENYFLYYEELDLVKRLARKGYRWTVAEESFALHRRGESVGSASDLSRQSLLSTFYGTRSAIVYTRIWERPFALTVTGSRAAHAMRLSVASPPHAWATLRAIASAWSPRAKASGLLRSPRQADHVTSTDACLR